MEPVSYPWTRTFISVEKIGGRNCIEQSPGKCRMLPCTAMHRSRLSWSKSMSLFFKWNTVIKHQIDISISSTSWSVSYEDISPLSEVNICCYFINYYFFKYILLLFTLESLSSVVASNFFTSGFKLPDYWWSGDLRSEFNISRSIEVSTSLRRLQCSRTCSCRKR